MWARMMDIGEMAWAADEEIEDLREEWRKWDREVKKRMEEVREAMDV